MRFFSRRLAAALVGACLCTGPALASGTALTVLKAFDSYAVGAQITDPVTIAVILAGPNASSVVQTGTPAPSTPGVTPTPGLATGLDASANAPAIPLVGANFGGTGPYAGYVLVKMISANPLRFNVEVADLSGGPIVVLRDDGTAAAGTAPVNATIVALGGGATVGAQGGSYASTTFKGRLQVYVPAASASTAFVSASQD